MKPGASFSFDLIQKQGAALVTKHSTYPEDIEAEDAFEEYTKHHYSSWVTFAREKRLGNDIKPIIVTGVDMTRDFAMMAYSNKGARISSKFTITAPLAGSGSAPVWGKWDTQGLVHTNCGPHYRTLSPHSDVLEIQRFDTNTREIPKQYNQCVFVRYYTMRWRALVFPKVIKAAAGPRDLGPGNNRNETLPDLAVQLGSDLDTEADMGAGRGDSTTDHPRSVIGHDSELEISHNVSSVCLSLPHWPPFLTFPIRRKEMPSTSSRNMSSK